MFCPDGLVRPARVVPLLGDQLPVPSQDRIGGHDGRNLSKDHTRQELALDRQASPLSVAESDPLLATGLSHDLILSVQVLDDLLLLAVDSPSKDDQKQLPRMQMKIMVDPNSRLRKSTTSVRSMLETCNQFAPPCAVPNCWVSRMEMSKRPMPYSLLRYHTWSARQQADHRR